MSRTNNSFRNLIVAITGQFMALIISFFTRTVFVKTLSANYLGLNGLFTNILSILSLAELGIGSAIVFSMYKPLAENDENKLKALMLFYKKAYIIIGIIIAIVGISLTPFLEFFIKEIPNDVLNIKIIYILFVMNSSVSYFFTYKRSLIIADQKRYIATIYRYGFYFLLNIFQILVLITTENYLIYLILMIVNTLLENIFVSKKANKLYPFLKSKSPSFLEKEDKIEIKRNVFALMIHKLGGTVVNGTDNILISKFVGLIEVGLYSNYLLIINALTMVFNLFFQSFTASIGNLGATETKEKNMFIFNCLNLIGFWIFAFSSICILFLINPFISIWIGDNYTFSNAIVIIIVINFYLNGMRRSVLTFRESLGLFWYDRHKPFFEVTINITASIILVKVMGLSGIFIGTMISRITTCFWIEPLVLYRYGFNMRSLPYFRKYTGYTIVMLVTCVITWIAISNINMASILGFITTSFICFTLPNIIFLIVFHKTKEFKYMYSIVIKRLNQLKLSIK